MKKTALFVTLAFIVIAGGSYWAYKKFYLKTEIGHWDVMPSHAVFIYERSDCDACWKKLIEFPIAKTFFESIVELQSKSIAEFLFSSESELISLHVKSKDDFDLLFYQGIRGKTSRDVFFRKLQQDKSFSVSSRELDGLIINELITGDHVFTSVQLGEIWVGSFTPFLVEDVVRLYKNGNGRSYQDAFSWRNLPQVKNDAGNFYINYETLPGFLKIFDNSLSLPSFGSGAKLDIKKQEEGVVELNGFTTIDDSVKLLSMLSGQTPVSFDLKRLITNDAFFVTSIGISSGVDFYRQLKKRQLSASDSLTVFLRPHAERLKALIESIQDELAICYTRNNKRELIKTILIESNNSDLWNETLQQLALETESGDTVFVESYANAEIRRIDVENFPVKLFYPFVRDFQVTYYALAGDVILLSEDLSELKNFLEDVEQENTWGKVMTSNRFFESTLLESNLSFYFDSERALNAISDKLTPKWSKHLKTHKQEIKNLGRGAIQFSNLNENFYTNIFLSYTMNEPNRAVIQERETTLSSEIIVGPAFVKNHADKSYEVLVQDSLYNLCLIGADGKLLWKQNIGSEITSPISQVDYFKNGKLQYFFATEESVFVMDRLGNPVTPFPVQFSQKKFNNASVVDYDRSRNYRFLLKDKGAKIWMIDKSGNLLDGWNPFQTGLKDELVFGPEHFRVAGKDYFIVVTKTGTVLLTNRRGERIKRFPIETDVRPQGNYFVESGRDAASSQIIFVSRDGFRLRVNLEGKILSKETLIKSTVDAVFSLVKEKNNKSYLIIRQDTRSLSILNNEGKEVINNEFVANNRVFIDYVDYGLDNEFIIITDQDQNLTYLYDGKGTPLLTTPMDSQKAAVVPGKRGFELITVNEKSIKRSPIQ
ncbi:MAG: hypothetical protein L0Y35_08745 [Flammeovirgaceae bacterium]|nr:hypothetical protein [Flammeovirgaceae bacterium]